MRLDNGVTMRQWRSVPFVILVALGLAMPAFATDEPVLAKDPHVIKVTDTGFDPASLSIQKGDVVRWQLQDGASGHMIVSGNYQDQDAGDMFQFALSVQHLEQDVTFTRTGTFSYFANDHPTSMLGTITVTESTPVNAATWGRLKKLFETP
jgi:plastocyanin